MVRDERRLRRQKDFRAAYAGGKKVFGRYVVVFYRKNDTDFNRYGVVASKKIGKAVVRNKWKRRARELIREFNGRMRQGFDVVVLGRPGVKDASFAQITKDMDGIIKRAGLYL
ncbi:MAG: ribonuclease P protein component [Syntrophomonadaceae bacterium]|nr:ribonuclease P protein component [Syntrophomonadaceae bacterium]